MSEQQTTIVRTLITRCVTAAKNGEPAMLDGLAEAIRASVFDDNNDIECRMVEAQQAALVTELQTLSAVKVPPAKTTAKKAAKKRAGGCTTPKKK